MGTVNEAARRRGRRAPCWCAVLAAALASCTAADNLSYAELAAELDGIVRLEGVGAERRLAYAEHAATSAWYMRSPLTLPLRPVLGALFGARHERQLENPSGHVRELLAELADEAGSDLTMGSDAVVRYALIAELDPSAANRIAALDGACATIAALAIPLFDGPADQVGVPADPAMVAAARAGLQLGRPENRPAPAWAAPQRAAYVAALDSLVARPLDTWSDRLALVGELAVVRARETDAELHARLDRCLRAALRHAVEGTLLRTVQGREPPFAEVRVCAMQQVRRFGGPRAVQLLLAVMAAPADLVKGGAALFDPDQLVQLQLIRLCGQLRGELALGAVRLPGREAWEAVAPADHLARTALNEHEYYSRLRVPALTALSLCLGRPRIDYDLAWVDTWFKRRS